MLLLSEVAEVTGYYGNLTAKIKQTPRDIDPTCASLVACSGRVDPQFVLLAFRQGAEGVLILACHPGDCHYKEGNDAAVLRHRIFLRLLAQFGIEKERRNFDYVSAGEGVKFVRVMTEMVCTIKGFGPITRPHPRE